MVIRTESRRLAWAARLCHWLPPAMSGRVMHRLYPRQRWQQEDAAFEARSSLGNVRFRFPRAEVHGTPFAIRGFYEWRNVVIANVLCGAGDTIVDVGSNIGTETFLFADIVGEGGHVSAFEPNPANMAMLQETRALNRMSQITLHQNAVSDHASSLRFVVPPNDFVTGIGRVANESCDESELLEVESVVLDELYRADVFPEPRLLVMDVEGSELSVLRGAEQILAEAAPYVILEVSPPLLTKRGLRPQDLYRWLENRGYRNWTIARWGLQPASPDQGFQGNWVAVPDGDTAAALHAARVISQRLKSAACLPLFKNLNPAVVSRTRVVAE
jgi:FkbM family methyltransferase